MARTPSAPRAPTTTRETPAAHVPSTARVLAPLRAPTTSTAMADLRAELNHRRDGEDSHITIERQRERRRNIEGHNLEGEFDSHAGVGSTCGTHHVSP
jgi:hypothetical protein